MKPLYAVGLDLSLTCTGVATISLDNGHVALGLVETAPAGDDLAAVLDRLGTALQGIASRVPADRALVVVEAPSHGSKHGKAHERAGLWWRAVAYLHSRGHVIAQAYPRTRAKYAAGHRPVKDPRKGPSKREIVAASKAEFPHLGLNNDNIADAFALARMGARHLGSPIDPTTRQRVESVAAVRWPDSTTEGMN
ncbi:hypothetical protein [Leucobacter sp. GX24907]